MTPLVLTIAGTDPSGGAGIQVDLQVFRDFGCHGLSAITAVIAQNTQGVRYVEPVSADMLHRQLNAVAEDFSPAARKVGVVPTPELIEVVIRFLQSSPDAPVVWDPVLASGDGVTQMTRRGTVAALRRAMPLCDVVTPNIPEAEVLVGASIHSVEDAKEAAATLVGDWDVPGVLLKTGHLTDEGELQDIWADDGGVVELTPTPRIDADVRGTGCQLSSAIAARMALGDEPRVAVEAARAYLSEMLQRRERVGKGRAVVVRTEES